MFEPSRAIRRQLVSLPLYYGWIVAAVCFVCSLVTFGTIYTFGVFFESIVSEFDQSHAGTSVVFSVQSIVTFGGAALLGIFIDRYGVRKLMAVATALVVAGLTLASLAPSFWVVVVGYSVVAAAGLGAIFVISYATPTRWFTRRRGLATAIATSGSGIGIVVIPPLIAYALPTLGWRGGYTALAVAFLVVFVLAWVVLADHPDDVEAVSTDRVERASPSVTAGVVDQLRAIIQVGWSPSFGLLFLGLLCAFAPAYIVLVHGVEYTNNAGLGRSVGVFALSLMGGMNVFGKFVVGPLSDRVGSARALSLCAVSTGTGGLLIPFASGSMTFLLLTAFLGIGYGGMGALLSPAIAEMFGTLNLNALFGLVSTSFAVAGSVVPYLAGATFDQFGTFDPAFLVAGVAAWVAVGLFLITDRE